MTGARGATAQPAREENRAALESPLPEHVRVAVVGAGFAGLGMAAGLLREGVRDFVVLERAMAVGGTWRDNTYPGCACDIPSNLYSFSWAPNPDWSRSYGSQQEILDYQTDVARRFGIEPYIRLGAALLRADWDDDAQRWRITTSRGTLTAAALVSGCGPLAEPSLPPISGLDDFAGTVFHSARWRHDHDLRGERVGVIGTGASAVQFVPQIQRHVAHLTLFQRTAPWVAPRGDHAVSERTRALYRAFPPAQRAARAWSYWLRELTLRGFVGSRRTRALVTRQVRAHLEAQVSDPELRRTLTPDYDLGCKRVLVSDDYYPALTRPNVHVETERIVEVRTHAVVTADGVEHEVDTLILGTGFHVTDNPAWALFHRVDGRSLLDIWEDGAQAHRGTTVATFPNLYLLVGPNTGLGHNSIIYMIEAQVGYVLAALRTMERKGLTSLGVRPDAQDRYNADVQRRMTGTVWTSGGCTSWYLDRHGRNPTLWPTHTFTFARLLSRFDEESYAGVARPTASA